MSTEKTFVDPSNAEKILTDIYIELNAKVDSDNIPGATDSSIGGVKSGGNINVNPDDGAVTVNHANEASRLYEWRTQGSVTTLNRWCKVASVKLATAWGGYHAVICTTERESTNGMAIFIWDCLVGSAATVLKKNKITYIAGSGDLIRLYKNTFYTEAIVEDDGVLFTLWCEPKQIHYSFNFTILNESKYGNVVLNLYNMSEYTTEPLTGQVNYYTENDWYGNSSSATKLTTSAGSENQPVYFKDGKPIYIPYTIEKSVPSDAKFTDTTYSDATQTASGLMSAEDKAKLDGLSAGGGSDSGLPEKKRLNDMSWAEIDAVCKAKLAWYYWSIGDTKNITLSTGEKITVRIEDFDHDTLDTGSVAPITFGMVDCLNTTHSMNNSNTSDGGWDSSAMREFMSTLFNQFPSDLQSVIKPVIKISGYGGGNVLNHRETIDRLWLFSFTEVTYDAVSNEYKYNPHDEGSIYPLFISRNSRIKKINGSASDWWLRSPNDDPMYFYYVKKNDGMPADTVASSPFGVIAGFCI